MPITENHDRYMRALFDKINQDRFPSGELMDRIEEVLSLARIGVVRDAVEAVDPAEAVRDVLKGCAEQIARERAEMRVARVDVAPGIDDPDHRLAAPVVGVVADLP